MLRRALQGGPQSVPSMLRTLDCSLGLLLGTLAVGVLCGFVVRNGQRVDSETGEEIPYYVLSDSVAE